MDILDLSEAGQENTAEGMGNDQILRECVTVFSPEFMTRDVFDRHLPSAVSEVVPANLTPPAGLIGDEHDLYQYLLSSAKGRLEQEFIAPSLVQAAVQEWAAAAGQGPETSGKTTG